ncbi:BBP7 family outer membrane beta-barrel protein [Anatilimnocola sp. NA78]|uniref:BBP7 family outer membrane beta-barrel protein n=1 Tax=Anatilimnocola sp. NA78 TaxID=3415683 RepID=UPI003CE55130
MKTNLRLVGALMALLLFAATPVPAQEVRQALADTVDVMRQSTWLNDADGSYNPCPAEDTWCGDESCGVCNQCSRALNMWAQVEYLMWWGKGSHVPALVTTSSQVDEGVIGNPTTQVLFGDELLGDEVQSGLRGNFGIWLDQVHNVGLGVKVFGLEGDQANFFAASTGDPLLARPFFNAQLGFEDALLIAALDGMGDAIVDGSVAADYKTSFVGTDVYTRIMMERDRHNRVDLIGGYSYLRLADALSIRSLHTARQGIIDGTVFDIRESFSTSNVFHGGMLGLQGTRARGRWSADWLTKLSFGNSHQNVRIRGTQTQTPLVGLPTTYNGGLLAQQTNIGDYNNSETIVIPELTVNLNYHLNSNISLGVGYNLIWLSSAITTGPEIDRRVNLSQLTGPLVGPAQPAFPGFVQDDYWLMGLNFSLRAEY